VRKQLAGKQLGQPSVTTADLAENPQDWESFLDTNECPSMISIYLGGMQGRTNTYSNNIIALHITKKRNLDR
jgi:hypothetical protein